MTPEELKIRELEMAQAEVLQQQIAEQQQQAAQYSYEQMQENSRQIQEDVRKREAELSQVGYPSEPYLPHSYSAPGVMLGDRISAVGQSVGEGFNTVGQTVSSIGESATQGFQNLTGGIVGGLGHMMSDIGAAVRPIFRTPPMGVSVGYGGYHIQTQGFLSSLAGSMGVGTTPRNMLSSEYRSALASDAGERLGYGTASALATAGGVGASVLAAKLPGVGTAGAAIGRGVGGMIGMGRAGAAIGKFGLPWLALPMAAYELGSMVSDQGLATRRRNQGFLEASSFRFAGIGSEMADPRMGRGISRDNRREIAEFLRSMDIEESLMGGEDITKILEEGTRFGLFEGFGGEIEKFKKKFTEIKDNVKEMAKVLNVSLDEGLATMKEIYGAGIDPSRARELSTFASAAGRVAGRTGSEMITLGLQGAEQFRGTGVSMEIGMRGAMMNLTAIRAARDAGFISKEAIEQAGGEEALALRRTQRQVQFAQSGEGRAYMASFFDQTTGGLNATAFEEAIVGGKDIAELARDAARNLNDPAKLIQFESQQERVASEMGKAFGGRGLQFGQWGLAMAEATYMSKYTGATTEDAFRSIMLRKGVSPQEIEAIQGEISGAGDIFKAKQKAAGFERDRLGAEEAERNRILNEVTERLSDVSKALLDVIAKPLNKMIDKMTEGVEKLSDSMEGRVRGDVSKIPSGLEAPVTEEGIRTGPQISQERKKELYSERSGALARDEMARSVLASAAVLDTDTAGAYFNLGDTPGENLQEFIEEGALGSTARHLITTTRDRSDLSMITSKKKIWVDSKGDELGYRRKKDMPPDAKQVTVYSGLTEESRALLTKRGAALGISDPDLEKLAESGRLEGVFQTAEGKPINLKAAIGMATVRGTMDPSRGLDENINALIEDMGLTTSKINPLTGEMEQAEAKLDDLTFEQQAAIVHQMRRDPRWKDLFEEARGAVTQMQSAVESGEALTYKKLGDLQENLRDKLESIYDVDLPTKAAADLGKILTLKEDLKAYRTISSEQGAGSVMKALSLDTSLSGADLEAAIQGKIKSGDFEKIVGKDIAEGIETRLSELSDEERSQLSRRDFIGMIHAEARTSSGRLQTRIEEMTGELAADVLPTLDESDTKKLNKLLLDVLPEERETLSAEEVIHAKSRLKQINQEIRDVEWGDTTKRAPLEKERLLLQVKLRGTEGVNTLADLNLLSTTLVSRQKEMAKNLYGGLLSREMIESDVSQSTVDKTRTLISSMVDSPMAMAERLTDKDKLLLGETKTGRFFLSEGEDIRKLQENITNLEAEREDVTETTFTEIFGGTRGKKMFERYEESGNIADVIGASFNEVISSSVGTQKTAGGGYVTDTALQSSVDLFQVLTDSNLATLRLLQSLHQDMKGVK